MNLLNFIQSVWNRMVPLLVDVIARRYWLWS